MTIRSKLFLLIIVSLILLGLDRLRILDPIKQPLLLVLEPLRVSLYRIERNVNSSLSVVTQISTLNSQNRDLEKENAVLKAENEKLKQLTKENTTLQEQLKVKNRSFRLIKAENYGIDPETKDLIIRATDKIELNQSVVVGENLIGKVTKVEGNFARVQRPINPSAKIPVTTSSNLKGITEGKFQNEISLPNLLAEDKISEKELLRTTGESGYVKNLVVGQVISIKSSEKSLFKEAIIESLINPVDTDIFFVISDN